MSVQALPGEDEGNGEEEVRQNGAVGGEAVTDPGTGSLEVSDQPEEGTVEAAELSVDEVFDILRNSRRRQVLSYLLENGERASVKELTRYVASEEYDVAAEDVTSEQHKRVYTALHQCHLERLDEYSVVDFDTDVKQVSLDNAAPQVEPYLDHDDGTRAARVELVTATTVASLVTVGVVGVGPFGAVSVTAWALLTVVALVGLAIFRLNGTSHVAEFSNVGDWLRIG